VHNAIVKTLDGSRRWNPEISIVQHLIGVVRSDLSHLARGPENQRTRFVEPEGALDATALATHHRVAVAPSSTPAQELAVENAEFEALLARLFKDDANALRVGLAMFRSEEHSAHALSQELHLDPRDTRAAMRRFRRRMTSALNVEAGRQNFAEGR
jgi:hypothetical protein